MPAEVLVQTSPSEQLARSLIDDTASLVSPPDVCIKINDLVADDHSSVEDIAGVVIRDPSLTLKVLKLANSSFYGLSNKVDTVSRAVSILGVRELQKLVNTLCAVQSFSKLSSAITNMNAFWRHAVYAGLTAQSLARHARVLHPERLFVAGVLHDIGSLLINKHFPEIAEVVIREANGNEDELYQIEQERLGFDHAYLAGLMLDAWKLPGALVDAISWHHAPHRARAAPVDAAILKVADVIANFSGTGSFCEMISRADTYDVTLLHRFGITINCTNDELMDEVDRQFVDSIHLIIA
jgi:HD-like signal output (HDOD) protein